MTTISLLREKELNGYSNISCRNIVAGYTDDMVKGFQRAPVECYHDGCINSVKFSRDGRMMVSGSDDGYVKLWDACNFPDKHSSTNGKQPLLLGSVQTHHTQNIFCADICPCNENWIISCAADGTIRLNDISHLCSQDTYNSLASRESNSYYTPNAKPSWDHLDTKERVLTKSIRMM